MTEETIFCSGVRGRERIRMESATGAGPLRGKGVGRASHTAPNAAMRMTEVVAVLRTRRRKRTLESVAFKDSICAVSGSNVSQVAEG